MDPDGRRDDHRVYEDMAVAHVMGGLDEEEGRLFRAHLLECGDCRARVGELRAIAHELAGVERSERQLRSAKAVEMKSREADDDDDSPPPRPRRLRWSWGGRLLVIVALALFVLLGGYVFTLRGQISGLQEDLERHMLASAALEHGRELSIIHTAPDVSAATAKRHDDTVVALLEGLDDEHAYGLYAVDDADGRPRTAYRDLQSSRNGRLFVLFPLQGGEDRFIVTRPSNGFGADPSGATVFEVHLDRYADE